MAVFVIFGSIYTSRHYFLKTEHRQPLLPRQTLTAFDENNPIWSNEATFTSGPLISSNTKVDISNLKDQPYQISFDVRTVNFTKLIIRRIYFPGWILELNGEPYKLSTTNGFLSTELKAGIWKVNVYFIETPLRKTANAFSLVSLIIVIGLFIRELTTQKQTKP